MSHLIGMICVPCIDLEPSMFLGLCSRAKEWTFAGSCPSKWVMLPSLFPELLLDWKQNADEIIVKLNLGSGALKVEDVDAAFTDTDCVVKLPGTGNGATVAGISPAGLGTALD